SMASPPACAGPPALPSSPSTPGGCLATPELASLPPGSCAACQGVSFHIQIGLTREFVLLPAASDLAHVKQLACSIVDQKFPECGFYGLYDKILLFKHDLSSANILQLVRVAGDIQEGDLVEVVLSGLASCKRESACKPHHFQGLSLSLSQFSSLYFELERPGLRALAGCGALNYLEFCSICVSSKVRGGLARLAASPSFSSPSVCPHSSQSAASMASTTRSCSSNMTCRLPTSCSWCVASEIIASVRPSVLHLDRSLRRSVRPSVSYLDHSGGTRPTVCQFCKKLLKGLFRQGLQCKGSSSAVTGCNKRLGISLGKGLLRSYVPMEDVSDLSDADKNSLMDESDDSGIIPGSHSENELRGGDDPDDDASKSQGSMGYIPLMRVVQSVRHTNRKSSTALKEGWMVHYSSKDTLRRYQWKPPLPRRALSQNNPSSRYYKEIPLSEILAVELAQNFTPVLPGANLHCFEIVTANATYYVGENCAPAPCSASQQHSGVGLEVATAWENAIRQALMPVILQDAPSAQGQAPHRQASLRISVSNSQIEENVVSISSRSRSLCIERKREQTGQEEYKRITQNQRSPGHKTSYIPQATESPQSLRHAGIVNLECMFETPEKVFVVMEKLHGDMLEMILSSEKGRLPQPSAPNCPSFSSAPLGGRGEPTSVRPSVRRAKLCLGRVPAAPGGGSVRFARIIGEKSFRRSVVGTPAYLAPEVLLNQGYNRSLDMWSVGVIIWNSLSNPSPCNTPSPPPPSVPPQGPAAQCPLSPTARCPSWTIDLINNLLQVKMRKRYSVDKSPASPFAALQDYQTWLDLRELEAKMGERYITHESDDARWEQFAADHPLPYPAHLRAPRGLSPEEEEGEQELQGLTERVSIL
uniref:protein kinase C n=1 Tax=Pelodiscus sinensis TaxID=13735 RepID=K7GEL8_PELSI